MSCGVKWLLLCAALAAGEACGFAAARFAALWPAVVAAAVLLALAALAFDWRAAWYVLVFLFGVAVSLLAARERAHELFEGLSRGKPFARVLVVEGGVRTVCGKNGVEWTSFDASTRTLRLRVIFAREAGQSIPEVGETWDCAGWLERTEADDPSRRRRLWVRGALAHARRIAPPSGRAAWTARLAALRAELSRRMGLGLDASPDAADLNRAILLGERRRLARRERDAFVAAGTIHVFAISGLHVMLVSETAVLLLRLLGCPRRAVGVPLLPLLVFYVALTGFSPSAIRAASMAALGSLAPLFLRRPDGLVAWSITFLAVYGFAPLRFYDVGCALSFAVMLGLVLWGRCVPELGLGRLSAALGTTFVAWAAGVPIVAHAFGRITPGGLVANLALLPAAALSVKAALLGLLASFVSDALAAHLNNLAALVTEAMRALSHVVASVPGSNLAVVPWSTPLCVAWYVALALSLYLARRVCLRRRFSL